MTDGSGVRIVGSGSHLEIGDNVIHDMRGRTRWGIAVYATEATAISDLVIDGNETIDFACQRGEGAHQCTNGSSRSQDDPGVLPASGQPIGVQ
jgi:hypothetical protein